MCAFPFHKDSQKQDNQIGSLIEQQIRNDCVL